MKSLFYMNDKVYNYCLTLLSKRDYSEKKIIEKILSKGLNQAESERIIKKLKDENFLNPKRYLSDKVETLAKKGFSLQYIQQKLYQENIELSTEEIQNITTKDNIDIIETIKYLLDKKLSDYINRKSNRSEQQLISKAMMFLSSKGYDYYQAVDLLPKELRENIE